MSNSPDNSANAVSSQPMAATKPAGTSPLQGEELCRYVANCLKRGATKEAICAELIDMGYSPSQAGPWVDQFTEAYKKSAGLPRFPGESTTNEPNIALPADEPSHVPHMWIGGFVCAIGIFITVSTYSAAQQNGGAYYVAPGLIIWGGIEFFLGLYRRLG